MVALSFLEVKSLFLCSRKYFLAMAAIAMIIILSGCFGGNDKNSPEQKEQKVTVSETAALAASTGKSDNMTSGKPAGEEKTTTAPGETTGKVQTTGAARTTQPPSTEQQTQYNEWKYISATGKKVTYTENPLNSYIAKASEQLEIPARRLGASYYEDSLAILVFTSPVKNRESLEISYFTKTSDVKVEVVNLDIDALTNLQKILLKSTMKKVALQIYDDALKNRP
jgi:hypothetical protein